MTHPADDSSAALLFGSSTYARHSSGVKGEQQRKNAYWLWLALACVAVIGFWAAVATHCSRTGWDFSVFYIAASVPTHSLYNYAASATFWQHHLAPLGVPHWARFVRLPVFSFLIRPIGLLPYNQALWAWIMAGLCAYIAAVAVLIRRFQLSLLMVPAFAAFFPAIAGLLSGQDNCLLLLGVTAGWMLLERKRDALAGLAFALCLYKFNLIVLIPLLLLLHKRYRAFGCFVVGTAGIASASFAVTPLRTYMAALREVPKETAGFFPVGLRGLTAFFGQDWCYPVLAAIVFLVCCSLIWRLPVTESFCVALTGGLLIVPYVCWYDSTLLVIPLALIYSRGSARMRAACVLIVVMVAAWPILFTHVSVAMFVLVYFLRGALKPTSIWEPSPGVGAAHETLPAVTD